MVKPEKETIYDGAAVEQSLGLKEENWNSQPVAEENWENHLQFLDGTVEKHARIKGCIVNLNTGDLMDLATSIQRAYSAGRQTTKTHMWEYYLNWRHWDPSLSRQV